MLMYTCPKDTRCKNKCEFVDQAKKWFATLKCGYYDLIFRNTERIEIFNPLRGVYGIPQKSKGEDRKGQ